MAVDGVTNRVGQIINKRVINDLSSNGIPQYYYEVLEDTVMFQMVNGIMTQPNTDDIAQSVNSLLRDLDHVDRETQLEYQEAVFHRLNRVYVEEGTVVTAVGEVFELAGESFYRVAINATSPKGEPTEFYGFIPIEALKLLGVKRLGLTPDT